MGVPRAIKLVCTSWDQLGALLENDLRRGVCRVRLPKLPAIGSDVKIDLGLPSGNSVIIGGQVRRHAAELDDPIRGSGVEVVITHFPPDALWLIEASLKAAREPQPMTMDRLDAHPIGPDTLDPLGLDSVDDLSKAPSNDTWNDKAAQEFDPLPTDPTRAPTGVALVQALRGEKVSLESQNPFEQLGARFDATDEEVRAAFYKASKRYSPDQLARYDSDEAQSLAGEIYMILRDAYRKIGDASSRDMTRALLRHGARRPGDKARSNPTPTPTPTVQSPPPVDHTPPAPLPPVPSTVRTIGDAFPDPDTPPPEAEPPKATSPFPVLKQPILPPPDIEPEKVLSFRPSTGMTPPQGMPPVHQPISDDEQTTVPAARPEEFENDGRLSHAALFSDLNLAGDTHPPMERGLSNSMIDPPLPELVRAQALLDAGHIEAALQLYSEVLKNKPRDREARAGKELAYGFLRLKEGDRLAAARHFEKSLHMIPANERAAQALDLTRRSQGQSGPAILERILGKK